MSTLDTMNFEQAIALVREKIRGQGTELSMLEEIVLEAAWEILPMSKLERPVKSTQIRSNLTHQVGYGKA